MSVEQDPIRWFRTASPYIYAHRNKTFVVSLDQDALRPSAFVSIARDLNVIACPWGSPGGGARKRRGAPS